MGIWDPTHTAVPQTGTAERTAETALGDRVVGIVAQLGAGNPTVGRCVT